MCWLLCNKDFSYQHYVLKFFFLYQNNTLKQYCDKINEAIYILGGGVDSMSAFFSFDHVKDCDIIELKAN